MGEVFCSHYVQVSLWVREMGEDFCLHYVQVGLGARKMGEVFCSHYVQVSLWVREMGEVFCSHYVQVSQRNGRSFLFTLCPGESAGQRNGRSFLFTLCPGESVGQRNGRSFLFTLYPGEYNWGSYEREIYRGSNMSAPVLLNLLNHLVVYRFYCMTLYHMCGSRNFRRGGGGGGGGGSRSVWQKKKLWQRFFFFFLVLSLFYRSQMVNFKKMKEIYHFSRFQRGSNIFQWGSNFFQGGGSNCPYNLWFSRGVLTPCPPLWIRTCITPRCSIMW